MLNLVDANELGDAACLIPVLDVKIGVGVVAESMGSGEYAFGNVCWERFEFRPLILVGIVAEEGYRGSGFVDNGDAALEFGDGHEFAVEADCAGAAEVGGMNSDELAA